MIPSKAEKEKTKLIQEKSQQYLSELLKDEDNKYCVDCDAKGPRWASWNLGVFLCIRCAGIHRNMGVHISKVKSVNLDSWSPAQVACMQRMGNSKARAVYEANLPDNFKRPQADSGLEAFVRAKYENKKYIAKEWVQPPTPPPAFDIDEERKKEKEKKKTKIIKSQASSSVIEVLTNPVPRPHSSPAGTVINADKVLINKNGSNGIKLPSSDLLGLSTAVVTKNNTANILNDDDQFDAFVSCPPVSSKNEELTTIPETKPIPSKTTEEEDFFNQKAPEEKKLDKESILKLYESSNIIQPHNNLFNINSTIQPLSLNPNPLVNNFTNLSANSLQPTSIANSFSSNNLNQPGNLGDLFSSNNPINNCVNGNFANFSNQNIQPANFNTQQPPFFNSTLINPTTNSTTSSTNPFLTTTVNDTSSIQSNDLFSSISTNNLKNIDSQLNNLNLNPITNSTTSINWPNTSNNFNANFNLTTGQNLFSANFDSEKKIDSNFNTTVLKETIPSVNPFLNTDTKNNLNDFDILSSINIQKPTNGINKINGNNEVIDNSNSNWSTLHTNNTNSNLATADLWQ